MKAQRRSFREARIGKLVCISALLLATSVIAGCTNDHISFLNPQGPIAEAQRNHYWIIVAVVMIVVLPVIILTPVIVWRYRYGGNATYRPKWSFSWTIDILIWGIPFVIVAVLSFFLWSATTALDPYKPLSSTKQPLRVQVVGMDWKWLFIYPDQGIATVNRLVFPANRPVAFELTSATVMQSFFIPALGSQIDAMNRMVTRLHLIADKPGSFQGKNMQYNGKGFYKQRFTALAVNDDAFNAFVKSAREVGRPLNQKQYEVLARPSTGDEAAKALGASWVGGAIRFSQVPNGLFSTIAQGPSIDWDALDNASSVNRNASASAMRNEHAMAARDNDKVPARNGEIAQ
ncbi:cytochrome ubiquinol oxidase subunit II family protein [Phytohalomonas tamaricis]|uniref:cytochrome ubiquinol oxidase subunit II n=1 Tax=Phytohalomonas tamaricis TaxID=2081032 RepID=UPI00131A1510|nr:cytochrome ubiquinol oxidase subunit II [Phytohalomonas tamaricis]